MKILSVFILTAFLFAGCFSNQKVIVTKEAEKNPVILQSAFSEFEAALKGGDFTQAERLAKNEDERKCVKAFALFAKGDEKLSEEIIQELMTSSDSLAKDYSKELLAQVYFSQCRWSELNKLSLTRQTPDMAERILSAAYSTLPKEEIIFNGSKEKCPVKLSSSGTPIVEVEVNGIKKHFWFDTGAGLSVIASDAAEECNVLPIGKEKAEGGTSTSINVGIIPAGIGELKFAGLTVKNHPVMIINKKDLEFKLWGFIPLMKIDGIIGWNLIEQLGWEIDYANKTILPFLPEKAMTSDKQNFIWFGYPAIVLKDKDGKELLFGLDTGAMNSSLSQYFTVADNTAAGEKEKRKYGGAGGFAETEVQKLKNISFNLTGNNLLFPEIYKKEHNLTSMLELRGVLGSDFPKEGKLILNFPGRSIEMR